MLQSIFFKYCDYVERTRSNRAQLFNNKLIIEGFAIQMWKKTLVYPVNQRESDEYMDHRAYTEYLNLGAGFGGLLSKGM